MAAVPVQPEITNTTALPVHFGLVVFPFYRVLDIFGPFDVFNSLATVYDIPMKLSVLSTTMDTVSSSPVGGPVIVNGSYNDFGESIKPTMTFAEYLAKNETKHVAIGGETSDIDVLVLPGGSGTRAIMEQEVAFVKAVFPKVKYVLSVCTGATIAARAGILDGRRATTNKKAWKWATSTGNSTEWIGRARWVDDGNIWSSSGVSAGTDMAYAWVSSVYGDAVSDYLSKVAEYTRWSDPNEDPFADIWGVPT
ncbi:class I glutamine amidotransferase-like protein [Pleomassaria siparia CBS 279.74]|uniref:Class I glutamine amidotransferase-like protein n=1 Tax=Pleomassaria siparia CBS 279.74 TaxID=1314801 RepID=A0A6G1KH01_9PLEO|nr:class I glutamine amidotransferase-like protein [Pleomassaria siparia CBS 279.74]